MSIDEQRRTYQVAQRLKLFWQRAAGARSRAGRLALLREMADIELAPDPYEVHSTAGLRRQFERQKQRGRRRLMGWCWVCQQESPDHRHHIIKLSAGGRNRSLNIVCLCSTCHGQVHGRRSHENRSVSIVRPSQVVRD